MAGSGTMFSPTRAKHVSNRNMNGFAYRLWTLNVYLERMITMKKTIRFVSAELFQEDKRNDLLEKMAKQGWILHKTHGLLWVFRKDEPCNARYSSLWHYFKENEDEKKNEMIAFIEEGGWHYVTSCVSLHIFKTEENDAVPLETDALTTLRALHKTMMKTVVLPVFFVVVTVALFTLQLIHMLFTSPLYSFGGDNVNHALIAMALLVLSAIAGLLFLIRYFFWYKKAKEEEVVIPFSPFPLLALTFGLMFIGIVFIWSHRLVLAEDSYMYRTTLIVMGVLAALFSFMQYKVHRQKSSMDVVKRSIVLVLVGLACWGIAFFVPVEKKDTTLSIQEAPLVKEDFGQPGSSQYFSHCTKNFLYERLYVRQYEEGSEDGFRYTYIQCHLPVLEDALFNDFKQSIYGVTFVESDIEPYGVDELYVDEAQNEYLFRKGNKMADIAFDWHPTEQELQYAIEAMFG